MVNEKLKTAYFRFSSEDEQMIKAAVVQAEKLSSAEIVPVVIDRSTSISHLLFLAFILGFFICLLLPWHLLEISYYGKTALWLLTALVLSLGLSSLILWFPFLQKLFLFEGDLVRSVRISAELIFHRRVKEKTDGQTGILIYVSMMEQRVELLADQAVSTRVPQEEWNDILSAFLKDIRQGHLVRGMVATIEKCGYLLGQIVPPTLEDKNELLDDPIFLKFEDLP